MARKTTGSVFLVAMVVLVTGVPTRVNAQSTYEPPDTSFDWVITGSRDIYGYDARSLSSVQIGDYRNSAWGSLTIHYGGSLTCSGCVIVDKGLLEVQSGGSLSASSINVGGTASLDGNVTVDTLYLGGGILSINTPITVGGGNTMNGTLNLNANLTMDDVMLDNRLTIQRNGGAHLDIGTLYLEGGEYTYDGSDWY